MPSARRAQIPTVSDGQLTLDLPGRRPALGREDFVVTPANAAAVAALEAQATWAPGKVALIGPAASGKTHLAHVWAEANGAVVVPADTLGRLDVPTLAAAGRVAIEDAAGIAGDRRAEAALFHLHNLLMPAGGRLLLTGRAPPTTWGIALPDLASRLAAAGLVRIEAPDDTLLRALLQKNFADRQLRPAATVIPFCLTRMTRTAAAARALVAEMDRLALIRGENITLALAREVLGREG